MLTLKSHRIVSLNSFPLRFNAPLADRPISSLVINWDRDDEFETKNYDRHAPKLTKIHVPEVLATALQGDKGNIKCFEETNLPQQRDYHPIVSKLLSGQLTERCKTYKMSHGSLDLLNSGKLKKSIDAEGSSTQCSFQLALALQPAALKRLQLQDAVPKLSKHDVSVGSEKLLFLPVIIHALHLYHFATGRVVYELQLELALSKECHMTDALLTEVVDHCGRFAELAWIKQEKVLSPTGYATNSQVVHQSGLTIGALVSRLVAGSKGVAERTFRNYTHTYAEIDPTERNTVSSELKELAGVLARQYNSDYAFRKEANGLRFVSDFENVVHAVAREGASTVVDSRTNGRSVSALSDYINTFEKAYLPLTVLNLHQLAHSLEINTKLLLDVDVATNDLFKDNFAKDRANSIVHRWDILQRDMTMLITRYRFRVVSQISMHNQFHEAMQHALNLEKLECQLMGDLKAISSEVQAILAIESKVRKSRFDQAYSWVPLFATGAAAALFVIELATGILSFATSDYNGLTWSVISIIFGVAIIGAAWAHIFKSRQ